MLMMQDKTYEFVIIRKILLFNLDLTRRSVKIYTIYEIKHHEKWTKTEITDKHYFTVILL